MKFVAVGVGILVAVTLFLLVLFCRVVRERSACDCGRLAGRVDWVWFFSVDCPIPLGFLAMKNLRDIWLVFSSSVQH